MEQNLGERERRIRLGIGIVAAALAVYVYSTSGDLALTAGLLLASAGFVANYFTCFCGTKKALNSIRKKIGG